MDADTLTGLRALVDRHRLRILGRLASRPADPETLAAELRLPVPVGAPAARGRWPAPGSWSAERRTGPATSSRPAWTAWASWGARSATLEREAAGTATRPRGRLAARRRAPRRTRSPASRPTPDEARVAALVPRRRPPGRRSRPSREAADRPALPARARLHRGPRLPREGGQPAAGAVPPGRRRAPPLPRATTRYVDREAGLYRRAGTPSPPAGRPTAPRPTRGRSRGWRRAAFRPWACTRRPTTGSISP